MTWCGSVGSHATMVVSLALRLLGSSLMVCPWMVASSVARLTRGPVPRVVVVGSGLWGARAWAVNSMFRWPFHSLMVRLAMASAGWPGVRAPWRSALPQATPLLAGPS